jgi:hypothetical protein
VIRASSTPAISVIQPWRSNPNNTVASPSTDHRIVRLYCEGIRGITERRNRGAAPLGAVGTPGLVGARCRFGLRGDSAANRASRTSARAAPHQHPLQH